MTTRRLEVDRISTRVTPRATSAKAFLWHFKRSNVTYESPSDRISYEITFFSALSREIPRVIQSASPSK